MYFVSACVCVCKKVAKVVARGRARTYDVQLIRLTHYQLCYAGYLLRVGSEVTLFQRNGQWQTFSERFAF